MSKQITSSKSSSSLQDKDTKSRGQEQIVFEAFKERPSTMLEISKITGIERGNICWHIKALREESKIKLHKKGLCSISKHRAGFYTTNADIFPKSPQQTPLL